MSKIKLHPDFKHMCTHIRLVPEEKGGTLLNTNIITPTGTMPQWWIGAWYHQQEALVP